MLPCAPAVHPAQMKSHVIAAAATSGHSQRGGLASIPSRRGIDVLEANRRDRRDRQMLEMVTGKPKSAYDFRQNKLALANNGQSLFSSRSAGRRSTIGILVEGSFRSERRAGPESMAAKLHDRANPLVLFSEDIDPTPGNCRATSLRCTRMSASFMPRSRIGELRDARDGRFRAWT